MQYWYLWAILIVLCVVTAIVLHKASAALQLHNEDKEAALAELKKLKALKEKYTNISAEVLEKAEPMEALEGANAVLQARVEKAEDAEACFAAFQLPQQYMYTLLYFLEDSAEEPAFYLRNNGEPLLSLTAPMLEAIGEPALSEAASTYFQDQKEKGEVVTDEALQKEYALRFTEVFDKERILQHAKAYMLAHRTEIFV